MKARRRRGLLLVAIALASGGLAASSVRERERSIEERVGPLVPVVVAARDLPADARLRSGSLALRRVPARFAPPGALGSAATAAGARTAVAIPAGGYVTATHLQGDSADAAGGAGLRHGERAVEIDVAADAGLVTAVPGSRVDVLVSTEAGAGGGRTFVALSDVELLRLGPAAAEGLAAAGDGAELSAPTAAATLRVGLRQAVYLAAADNFGKEIRLLLRPAGDRERVAGETSAAEL
jgi:pilus assembly protein CpaB